jgi:hypothetical protein
MLIAAAAAFFALAAVFGSGAQAAGFNVRLAAPTAASIVEKAGCGGGYRRSFRRRHHRRSVRRRIRRKVHVARKPAQSSVSVAKAEPDKKAEPEKKKAEVAAVESENSSISTADGKVAEAKPVKAEKKVVASKDVGCKQFFPAVGMTLSVSCE